MPAYTKRKLVVADEEKYNRNRWLLDQFNRYEEYYRTEIERMIQNQRMYWGVNFGQWAAFVVEKLIQQGRRPPTFNIIAKKIESQIGSYLSNGFDIKYSTKNGATSHWALALQDMAYNDKSNCDWESSEIVALRDMHVMVGYERMYISDRYDSDFGNIAYEALPPTHIFVDPGWKSIYSSDIKNYFEYGEYTAGEIVDLYPKAAEIIKETKLREAIEGIDYGEFSGGVQKYRSSEEKWNCKHRVITFHSIVKEDREWEYDLINRNLFPETGYDPQSEQDKMIKAEYINRMGLRPEDITTVRQSRRVKRLEAVCPSLNNEIFLASGRDRIQTNNCNLYPIGNSFYGQYRGMVDDLTDVQMSFNKGKMTVEDIQARTAKGAFLLDRALTGGDERVREEIESQWNNPAARIWVDEGSTADLGQHGGIIELKGHPATPEMFRVNSENLQLSDWLSTMPASMDARTESAAESGKLFQSKVQVGLVGQKYGMKIYERHKKEKAQAYPLQAKLTYAGYPREFRMSGTNQQMVINQKSSDQMGRDAIINDISLLPEMTVSVSPSAQGVNVRSELRSQYAELLPFIQNDPQDRLMRLVFIKNIFKTQDMPEEEKAELEKACDISLNLEAMGNTMKFMQAKQALAQMQQQTAPPPPGGAPGQPAIGGPQGEATPGKFDEAQAQEGTPQQVQE